MACEPRRHRLHRHRAWRRRAASPRIGELLENVAGSGEYHWMAGNHQVRAP
jgi:hypothetical protein